MRLPSQLDARKLGLITAWWLCLGVLNYFSLLERLPFEGIAATRAAVFAVLGWAASLPVAYVVSVSRAGWRIGGAIGGGLLMSVVWGISNGILGEMADPFLTSYKSYMFLAPGQEARLDTPLVYPGVMLSLAGVLLLDDQRRRLREQQLNLMKTAQAEQQARLEALRYQLNPHFLFNALNSIAALATEDAERTQRVVTQLADFLRYSLVPSGVDALGGVSVQAELEAIQTYLAIEKVRFEEELQVNFHVDPVAMSRRIPPFLLLPLVDNAVKHGQRTSGTPLRIEVSVTLDGSVLCIVVANTGRWVDGRDETGTRTGLTNVQQRLAAEYPGRGTLTTTAADGWVRVELRLTGEPG